jgi:hypothetical protein
MPKYKIVATGRVLFERSASMRRFWISIAERRHRIISIAGVAYDDIPVMSSVINPDALGRYMEGPQHSVAVRPSLTEDDFEVEIV